MNSTKRTVLLSILVVSTAFAARRGASANATVSFDTSGNGMLNGRYYVRLLSASVQASGTMTGANSVSGIMTFDGNGKYNFAGQNYASSSGQSSTLTYNGVYSVASSGMAQIENPLYSGDPAEQIYGAVSGSKVCVGSSTEGTHNDVFVGIPLGPGTPANSSFQGTYWVGALEFPQATTAKVRNSMFQLSPNGQGSLGTVTVTGRDATQQNNATLTQTSSGSSYSFGSNGAGTLTISNPSSVSSGSALFAGSKTFYISADGNYIVGGSANTFDIFFGFKALAGSASNSLFQGVYYSAGMDSDVTDPTAPYLFSFYASAKAVGNGTSVWHEREAPIDQPTYDYTFDSTTQLDTNGTVTHDFYKYAFGVSGDAFMVTGLQTDYSILIGVRAQDFSGSGVYLNPTGILNAASFSPVTNSVATGEIVSMYGQNLANSTSSASTLPLPTSMGGVQVMVNGTPAPIVDISPTRIDAIIPYSTSGGLVQFQVVNGTQSNAVTLYQDNCSPGVFTISSNGLGDGAIRHADFSLVNSSSPAKQGEVVLLYLTGLGDVNPPVSDGAAPPSNPLTGTTTSYDVYIGGIFSGVQGTVQFQGLAPGFPGLYQINVQIPNNAPLGDQYIGINTDNCYNEQAKIPIVAR